MKEQTKKLQKKCSSLSAVISELKEKEIVTDSIRDILEEESLKVPAQIFQRLLDLKKTSGCAKHLYTNELKAFALTLQFYSSKAYNYVRDTFDLCLPHESTVKMWYSAVNAEVGFTAESFSTLKQKVEEEKRENKEVLVSLMFDEMAIHKKVEWNGERFVGTIDLGLGTEPDDSSPPATEALVLMVVSLNSSWKLPIAYFLVGHLSSNEKVSIINTALTKLHEIGVKAVSVTCDAPPTNISTLRKLGASFDPSKIKCSFPTLVTSLCKLLF